MKRLSHGLLGTVKVRPRLFIVAAIAVLVGVLMPPTLLHHALSRWLVAWNFGAWLYIVLAGVMMVRSSQQHMRHRATLPDDGKYAILAMVVVAAIASLGAIAGELGVVKDVQGWERDAHMALAGSTVVSSWGFIQVMFALHYAHDYYFAVALGEPPGLQFPGGEEPDYGDFFYFAAVIGTSGQTADVAFTNKRMRRIGAVHCVLAYLFNTVVLALLVNIGASLV